MRFRKYSSFNSSIDRNTAERKDTIINRVKKDFSVATIEMPKQRKTNEIKLVVLGTSTGGPPALQQVIPSLPGDFPLPITVVQHMPPLFTKSLADRLNSLSKVTVKEAEEDDILQPGHVYIAPGDKHLKFKKSGSGKIGLHLSDHPMSTLHKPSVDVMMLDACKYFGGKLLGVYNDRYGERWS